MKTLAPMGIVILLAGCPHPGTDVDAGKTAADGCVTGLKLLENGQCVPVVEICDNNVDDDNNNLVDCADPACHCDPGHGTPDAGGHADAGTRLYEDCANGTDDDGDGLADYDDPNCQTDPLCARDADGDGVEDCHDNAPNRFNASQTDNDHDGQGDVLTYPSAPMVADGGHPDAGPGLIPCASQHFCLLVPSDFIPPAAGTDAGPLAGAVITDVPGKKKICFTGDQDYDQDGVRNCDDNCAWTANEPPHCTDNSGCVNAGGHCNNGTCSGQLDIDHDQVGDSCDSEPGVDNHASRAVTDPDPDSDGIPLPTDRCPTVVNSLAQNAQDSDGDGTPDICDGCALLTLDCQHFSETCPDRDSDGICDADDNCPLDFNPYRICSAVQSCQRGHCQNGRCTLQDGTERVGTVCERTPRQCDYRSLPWPHYADDGSLQNAEHEWSEHRFGGECASNDGIHGAVEPGAINRFALSATSSLAGGEQTFACNAVGAIFAPPELPSNSSCFLRFWGRADRLRTVRVEITTDDDTLAIITPDFGAWDFTLTTTWQGYQPSMPDEVPTGCTPGDAYCREFRVGSVNDITIRRVEFLYGNEPGEVQLDAVEMWCRLLECPM